jgi:hypothetical protein
LEENKTLLTSVYRSELFFYSVAQFFVKDKPKVPF